MASREQHIVRQLNWITPPALRRGVTRTGLTLKNMMQPFALPVAGGLASALLLFGLLLPDFAAGSSPDSQRRSHGPVHTSQRERHPASPPDFGDHRRSEGGRNRTDDRLYA